MRRLENKVIAVAGAGGIGSALAKRYAAEGAAVVVGDYDPEAADGVVKEILASNGVASAAHLDIADEDSVRRFVALAEEKHGGLDGFHANAASFKYALDDTNAVEIDLEVFDHVIHVNARGHLLCARHAIPSMLKRDGGAILFTSSGSAHVGDATLVAYAMSKSALHALTRHIASRWGKEGIRANAIAPGVIMHPELERKAPHLKAWAIERVRTPGLGVPEDIAAMGALLLSDEGRYITGQVISVDGGSSMRP